MTLEKISLHRFRLGFDDDDPGLHQFKHICHRYDHGGALCDSKRLWFRCSRPMDESDFERVDCPSCHLAWTALQNEILPLKQDPFELLSRWIAADAAIGELEYQLDQERAKYNDALDVIEHVLLHGYRGYANNERVEKIAQQIDSLRTRPQS